MADELTHRFKEGWVMLRRSFQFAELDYEIPKLSLVYVYSERPIYKMHIKQEYWERLSTYERREENLPDWLQVSLGESLEAKYKPQPNEQYETYEGEMVQTLFNGNLTKFYPEEYSITSIEKYQKQPDFHEYFNLRYNDKMYLKQEAIVNKVHYLCSRGMSRKDAELYASPAAKHSVWYAPSDAVKQYFENVEPLKSKQML